MNLGIQVLLGEGAEVGFEGVLPGAGFDAGEGLEFAGVEGGVRGAGGFEWFEAVHGVAGDGVRFQWEAEAGGDVESGLAVFLPGGGAFVAEVEEAGLLRVVADEGEEPVSEVIRVAGAGPFVVDGGDVILFAGGAEDHVREARFVGAEEPGDADDEGGGMGGEGGEFAIEFGLAVMVAGSGGVGFAEKGGAGAGEDVVAADVDEAAAMLGAVFGEEAGGDGIGEGSILALDFTGVDVSEAGGVDEEVEGGGIEGGGDLTWESQIELGASPGGDGEVRVNVEAMEGAPESSIGP